jgi:hypothetical protein
MGIASQGVRGREDQPREAGSSSSPRLLAGAIRSGTSRSRRRRRRERSAVRAGIRCFCRADRPQRAVEELLPISGNTSRREQWRRFPSRRPLARPQWPNLDASSARRFKLHSAFTVLLSRRCSPPRLAHSYAGACARLSCAVNLRVRPFGSSGSTSAWPDK